MEVRKTFKFEMAHIVRKAWSKRCSKNIHGHGYVVEVNFIGGKPDEAHMLVDFGILKEYMNDFIDSFDHSFTIWDIPEDKPIKDFMKENFERVIVTPFNTSAEMQAKMFFDFAKTALIVLAKEKPGLIGKDVEVARVKVHETATGYAEYNYGDDLSTECQMFPKVDLSSIEFSKGIKSEWKHKELTEKILNYKNK